MGPFPDFALIGEFAGFRAFAPVGFGKGRAMVHEGGSYPVAAAGGACGDIGPFLTWAGNRLEIIRQDPHAFAARVSRDTEAECLVLALGETLEL